MRDGEDFFKDALMRTLDIEGIYSNNPLDPGGETFMGISRHWHPSWIGWEVLDLYGYSVLPEGMREKLHRMVEGFYKVNFWDRLQGDKLAELSEAIAEKLFDTAVNLSVTSAIEFLQEGLNLLNSNKKFYPDIMVDGRLGPVTMRTLKNYLTTRPGSPEQNETRLLNVIRFLQGGHYISEMRKHPEKEIFRGWFDRAAA